MRMCLLLKIQIVQMMDWMDSETPNGNADALYDGAKTK